MPSLTPELSRLSFLLLVRGVFLVLLGAVAIRWPDPTLLLSLVISGGIAASLGLLEIAAASISRALPSTKLFLVAHGIISFAMGVLASALPFASETAAVQMAVAFVVAYGGFGIVLTARLQFVPRAREAVFAFSLFNFACGVILLSVTPYSIYDLLYAGALYGALLGFFHLFAAGWMRRGLRLAERRRQHGGLGDVR